MGFDTAYEAITEEVDDHRWAYGTGFDDPMAGMDWSLPPAVDGSDLAEYCLMLGDDALVMSHRLQQWLTRAPELEEETALANIALDLLGQARLLLTRAGTADGTARTEDAFAFCRDASQFRNTRFVESPSADFAELVVLLLVFSTCRMAVLGALRRSADHVLAAVATKSVIELAYHRDYAAAWVIRLGDGTDESRARTASAIAAVWPTIGELFRTSALERGLAAKGVAVDPADVRVEFDAVITEVMGLAGLSVPAIEALSEPGGRDGVHTQFLDEILDELQSVAREHDGATW